MPPPTIIRRLAAAAFLVGLALTLTACDQFTVADAGTVRDTPTPQLTPVPSVAAAEIEDCAAIVTEAGAAIVDTLRLANGTCVPVDVAVVYRCDPSFDPVAVLGTDDDRRRFLGGRFAVPVDALPEGARALGITALGRIFEAPDDPRGLFVETASGFERWMALPPLGDVADPPVVQLIGDSILDGANEALLTRLPTWTLDVDAEIGRSTSGGMLVAESLAPLASDLVVIELGVNDVDAEGAAGNVERIVTAAAEADGLLWVNAHGPDPETDAVNDAIRTVIAGSGNAAIVDWDGSVPPEALSSDGVHLLDGGGTAFVDVLAPAMQAWHLAAIGRGADRCGVQVHAAG